MRGHDDQGFTLVELLIVVIIIGILAGVAIPIFLSQRSKGYDAAAKNDVRNLAAFEELYLADFDTYGTAAEIQANEPAVEISMGVTVTVVHLSGRSGYCLSARSVQSATTWYYDSLGGGLQPPGTSSCPVIRSGPTGGSLSG